MADFQVYIIEAPAAKDVYDQRGEGELIRESLRIAKIEATLRVVLDDVHFKKALLEGLVSLLKQKDLTPVLHISAHGNDKGIGLANGHFVEWTWLGKVLSIVNEKLDGELLLCMSSCQSFAYAKHALKGGKPWKAIVGNSGKPSWNDTIIAYSSFYHLLAKGKTIQEAVEGMCAASGNPDFKTTDGETILNVQQQIVLLPPDRRQRLAAALLQAIQNRPSN